MDELPQPEASVWLVAHIWQDVVTLVGHNRGLISCEGSSQVCLEVACADGAEACEQRPQVYIVLSTLNPAQQGALLQ